MTTWAALFERGAAFDVDTATVRETLAAHRDAADETDHQRQGGDTDE
ncbi:hypothetical protein [Halobacterium bonnevillei]|uniref:Uncharacterized protein n=1 Tax=Halobacterium bonnevillei TaxID=2692200 RepID=A0A6B0SJB8_9EURY|nr:hypothetical protein [Halobacterium bonnevillei]MXR21798.1 hypothetical protein [Halobacterium bonnevillei]